MSTKKIRIACNFLCLKIEAFKTVVTKMAKQKFQNNREIQIRNFCLSKVELTYKFSELQGVKCSSSL